LTREVDVTSDLPDQVWRLGQLELRRGPAHDGVGAVDAIRCATGADFESGLNFVDYVRVPVGSSIGIHTHRLTEEEFYLILDGEGLMHVDGHEFDVGALDLIRNKPGGTHGLVNRGSTTLQLFVFESSVEA